MKSVFRAESPQSCSKVVGALETHSERLRKVQAVAPLSQAWDKGGCPPVPQIIFLVMHCKSGTKGWPQTHYEIGRLISGAHTPFPVEPLTFLSGVQSLLFSISLPDWSSPPAPSQFPRTVIRSVQRQNDIAPWTIPSWLQFHPLHCTVPLSLPSSVLEKK